MTLIWSIEIGVVLPETLRILMYSLSYEHHCTISCFIYISALLICKTVVFPVLITVIWGGRFWSKCAAPSHFLCCSAESVAVWKAHFAVPQNHKVLILTYFYRLFFSLETLNLHFVQYWCPSATPVARTSWFHSIIWKFSEISTVKPLHYPFFAFKVCRILHDKLIYCSLVDCLIKQDSNVYLLLQLLLFVQTTLKTLMIDLFQVQDWNHSYFLNYIWPFENRTHKQCRLDLFSHLSGSSVTVRGSIVKKKKWFSIWHHAGF